MNCERVRNLISAYLDQELSPEEYRLIRAHLVTCAACNAELEAETALKEALSGLQSHETPPDFLPGLFARLACASLEERRRLPYCVARWALVGAAAAVLLALPLARQWREAEHVVEAHTFYQQHALASAAQPLADRALTSYYYAVAGGNSRGPGAVRAADRIKLLGQSLPE